jgi:TrmH family RNA methyltransferase
LRLLTIARDLRRRKARERQSLFVVEGVRAVEELLRSPLVIRGVLTAPQLDGAQRGIELRKQITERVVPHSAVNEAEFRSAAETESPQGVLAIAEIPRRTLDTSVGPGAVRLLVLDAVQDPGNVGTIIRTAAALGVTATIALPGTVDLWNAKVVRSAMGAHFTHTALSVTTDELIAFLQSSDVELWGADAHGTSIESAEPPGRLAIAMGNEGGGLSSSVREAASRLVSLPIAAGVESLNVAVACGILLYRLRE